MKITKEMKEHIRNELNKSVRAEAERQIPSMNRKYKQEFLELEKIKKEEKEIGNKRTAVIKRLRTGGNGIVELDEYNHKFREASYSGIEQLLQKAIIKLQYEATDISQIGEIIRKVIAEV